MIINELIECLQEEDGTKEVVLRLEGSIRRHSECHGTMFGRPIRIYSDKKTIVLWGS